MKSRILMVHGWEIMIPQTGITKAQEQWIENKGYTVKDDIMKDARKDLS